MYFQERYYQYFDFIDKGKETQNNWAKMKSLNGKARKPSRLALYFVINKNKAA